MSLSKDVETILAKFESGEDRFALAWGLVESMGLSDSKDLIQKVSEVLGRDLTEQEKYAIDHLKDIMIDSGIPPRKDNSAYKHMR